jgi:pimeloyl-ACP methyl ester carboxylesterase
MGLTGLFVLAAAMWVVGGVWALLWMAKRPPGGSAGAALARGLPLDPAEAGLSYERWIYRTGDGFDLPVWDIVGRGSGDPVILIHNWGESPLSMLGRASELAAQSARIIVPCLRGHDGEPGSCSLGPREADDLARLLETLDITVRIEGEGFGGWIAATAYGGPLVAEVTATDSWTDPANGLRRILAAYGFPAFPIAVVANWCVSSR